MFRDTHLCFVWVKASASHKMRVFLLPVTQYVSTLSETKTLCQIFIKNLAFEVESSNEFETTEWTQPDFQLHLLNCHRTQTILC